MKHRRSRRKHHRRRAVVRNPRRRHSPRRAHRRRHHRAATPIVVNPRRRHRRRSRARFMVGHVLKRIRRNPAGSRSRGGMLPNKEVLTTGVAAGAGALAAGYLTSKLFQSTTLSSFTANQSTTMAAITQGGAAVAIALAGSYALRRTSPAISRGLALGAVVSGVYSLYNAYLQNSAGGGVAAGSPPAGGYSPTAGGGMAAYLGAPMRRRRMAAYLGGRRSRRMGAYLHPGQPVSALVGPVSPTKATYAFARGMGNLYRGGNAFKTNAWQRN